MTPLFLGIDLKFEINKLSESCLKLKNLIHFLKKALFSLESEYFFTKQKTTSNLNFSKSNS